MKKTLLFVMAAIISVAVNAQTIFSENFDGVAVSNRIGAIPEGWTTYGDNLTNYYQGFSQSWDVYQFDDLGKVGISLSYTGEGTAVNRWLITPAIAIADSGYCLTFEIFGIDNSYPEAFEIKISTTGVEKTDFTTSVLNVPVVPAGENNYLVNLDAFVGQSIHIAFVNKGANAYYLVLDNISVGIPIENEIALMSAKIPTYAKYNTDFSVKGVVKNLGVVALTSFDVTYNIDGGENVDTFTVSNINVAYSGTYEFTHNVPANIATTGNHTINVTVLNPNGVADDATNNTGNGNVIIYENGTQRTVLFEQFTTGKCPNCPPAHEYLAEVIEPREDNVVWLAHHAGYYTDNLTVPENEELLVFYNSNGTYAPAAMVDRTYFPESGEPGPVMSAYVEETFLDNQISVPSFVTVNISAITYDTVTRALSVTVSGEVVSDISGYNSPRVSLYIKEDGIKMSQSGASANYIHNNAMRDALSDVWGDADVITSTTVGSTFSKTYNYTIPGTWKPKNLELVAFVTEYNTNVNQRSVLNATEVRLADSVQVNTVGIVEASDVELVVYPNPATDYAMISSNAVITEVAIINTLGQTIATIPANAENVQINTQDLAQGIYMISITTAEGKAVKKLTVTK
ncbi:MAG: Omp28-related outer membrane protein [Bacteroidales bacterium]|nr:Omp28-related outer membrane protein [Bacteroidales bacterium]